MITGGDVVLRVVMRMFLGRALGMGWVPGQSLVETAVAVPRQVAMAVARERTLSLE